MLRRSWLAMPVLVSGLLGACAIGGDDSRTDAPGTQIPDPPQGGSAGAGGTFDPGSGGLPGSGASYGAGASSNMAGTDSGQGGQGGDPGPPPPPECTDDLKRCPHAFALPDAGYATVVVRGDFAADGWEVGVALVKDGSTWKAEVPIPYNQPVTYKYYVNGTTWVVDPDPSVAQVDDNFGGKNSQLTPATCDPWTCDDPPVSGGYDWRDAVLYFVFVDRFVNGDPSNDQKVGGVDPAVDYQGGDWKGLLAKINEGYFTDLGVNALWLTVPLDNTSDKGKGNGGDNRLYSAYHGYWPRNLDQPEEHFGTMADLKAVVDAAHARGIKVLLDYAMNHVHETSPVYQQHKDWFWPNDNGKGGNCVCGDGCSWDSDAERCWFTPYLPDFNFGNQAARDYSISNAIDWVKNTGVDGFRLDAIKHIDEQWVIELRKRLTAEIEPASGQHFYLVGETFTGDQGTIKKYINPATKLDGQFDFPGRMTIADKLLMRRGSMKDLEGFLAANESAYGQGALMSTFIGNHDIPRPIHLAEDTPLWNDQWTDGKDRAWDNRPAVPGGTSAFERLAASFTLLLTSRGVPLIYYGDEIGLAGAGDPDNRRMMQWDGYSAGQTLLRDRIKKLTSIRAEHPALRRGTRSAVSTTDDVLAYKMTTTGDTVYVAINRADGERPASGLPSGALTDLVTGQTVNGPSINVPARGAMVLVAK